MLDNQFLAKKRPAGNQKVEKFILILHELNKKEKGLKNRKKDETGGPFELSNHHKVCG